jgi:hypothetical protein
MTRTFAELLIDCEEDRTLRAVLVETLERQDDFWHGISATDRGTRPQRRG